MNMYWYIATILIALGVIGLTVSLSFAIRILGELNQGNIRKQWIMLFLLIFLFLAGYVLYLVRLPLEAIHENAVVGIIFFLGSIFVLAVNRLMLKTTRDVKRIASLEYQSITDPLLKIFNRRYLDDRLGEEIARSQRYGLPLSLFMIDIDHFKQVNDKYGHQAGDNVLITMSRILRENARKIDIAARYGGEELVMVLPNTDESSAMILAERLRGVFERTRYPAVESCAAEIECTVSIGVTSMIGSGENEGYTASELLHQADVAMYHAKKTGRNRVVNYSNDLGLTH